MASFLNKLKSTVSEVLPGNPLSGDYDIQDRVVGSAGPGLVWKIYRANKKTTKESASVFVFDKKSIDKLSRDDKKLVIASLRRGIQQLTKLRHPKILSVVHPIEENRDCLAFATEPVMQSLANVLELDSGENPVKIEEVEIKYGLIQVLEGLSFLHNDVKLVHGNLHPSSILLNDMRCWKLAGFDFYVPNSSQNTDQLVFEAKEWCSGYPCSTQPDLDYLAPEVGNRGHCETKSDMYSLGVAIHAMYNQGKPVYQCHDSLGSFKTRSAEMQSFRSSLLRNIPSGFHESFKSLLSYNLSIRPEAKALLKTGHFEDMSVMTLVYLDSLVQRDNLQKSQYFKNLPNILKQLSLSMCLHRVLPVLFSECSNKDMIPFVLQNVLVIADKCSKQDYQQHIFPKLLPIFKISQPIQIPLMLLKNMPLLLSKTSERDTRSYILPTLFTSIELQNPQLQELCLDILPEFSQLIDKQSMKSSVIPRVKNLCLNTQYLNLRVKSLISIGKMMTHMDKWFVLDEVLPFLTQVPSKEPAILMAMLGIYKIAFANKDLGIPKDQLATKALPFLIPLSVDHCLTKQQFTSYMGVIKEMLSTVERENLSKLKELEMQDKDESSLKFNGENSTDDRMMQGFLSEAGLLSGGATKVSSTALSKPTATADSKPTAQTSQPQVKNLTATLAAPTRQPTKPMVPLGSTMGSSLTTPTMQPMKPMASLGSTLGSSFTAPTMQPTKPMTLLANTMGVSHTAHTMQATKPMAPRGNTIGHSPTAPTMKSAKPLAPHSNAITPTVGARPMQPVRPMAPLGSTGAAVAGNSQPMQPLRPSAGSSNGFSSTAPSLLQPMSPAFTDNSIGNVSFAGHSTNNSTMSKPAGTYQTLSPSPAGASSSSINWGAKSNASSFGWSFNSTNYSPQQTMNTGISQQVPTTTTPSTLTQSDINDLLG